MRRRYGVRKGRDLATGRKVSSLVCEYANGLKRSGYSGRKAYKMAWKSLRGGVV